MGPAKLLASRSVTAQLKRFQPALNPLPTAGGDIVDAFHAIDQLTVTGWTTVILEQRHASADTIAALLDGGADDVVLVRRSGKQASLQAALDFATTTVSRIEAIRNAGNLIGQSPAYLRSLKDAAIALNSQKLPILVLGETGTGKGLLAKAMHGVHESRTAQPFHTLDCGGLTDGLMGSELFGHVKGAFTGALGNRAGAFESAANGTLLLDEVGEMPPALQSFLLNSLQERTFRPVGSDRLQEIHCRIVATTNRALCPEHNDSRFRRDLYFRLAGCVVEVPALCERVEDIVPLFECFLSRAHRLCDSVIVPSDVAEYLTSYRYPGNVRELESIAHFTAARMGNEEEVRLAHLPLQRMHASSADPETERTVASMVNAGMSMREVEIEAARQAACSALLRSRRRNPSASRTRQVARAADALGVSPRTIYNKINGAHLDD